MKNLLSTALVIAVTASAAVRVFNEVNPAAVINATIEKAAPITECYSIKLNRETGEKITTTYAC